MSGDFVLYGRQGGGSVAPQLVLEEMGAPYRMEWVDRDAAAPEMEAYRRICPTGKIPALGLPDGSAVFESAAICIYLTDLPGAKRLAPPSGTEQHARFLQWMVFMAANVYASVLRYYYPARYTIDQTEHAVDAVRSAALSEFEAGLALVDAQMTGDTLCEAFSAADLYLYMLAGWHPDGYDGLAAKYPKVGALCAAIGARPLVQQVMEMNGD